MNLRRLFILINIVLISLSGLMIYYLANAGYTPPMEIAQAEDYRENPPPPDPGIVGEDDVYKKFPGLAKPAPFFDPIYTPKPTPTPTPVRTPQPMSLRDFMARFQVKSASSKKIKLKDRGNNEEFEVLLGRSFRRQVQTTAKSVMVEKIEMGRPIKITFKDMANKVPVERFVVEW